MPAAPLLTLPYELLAQIAFHLDKTDLKTLRLVCRNRRLLEAASTPLFRELTIRMGTSEWAPANIRSRLEYLRMKSNQALQEDTQGERGTQGIESFLPFSAIKTLTVDTRYPYAVTFQNRLDWYDYQLNSAEAMLKVDATWDMSIFDFLGTKLTELEEEQFVELVELVVELVTGLKDFRWRCSDFLDSNAFDALCLITTEASHKAAVQISSSMMFTAAEHIEVLLRPSLPPLRALTVILGPTCSFTDERLGDQHQVAIAQTIERSTTLRNFKLFYKVNLINADEGHSLICDSLLSNEALESIEVNPIWSDMKALDWTRARQLKSLAVESSISDFLSSDESMDEIFDGLRSASVALKRLRTDKYGFSGHNYLLRPEITGLTHIRVECVPEDDAEVLGDLFWNDIVPKYADTLKSIKAYNTSQGSWSYSPNSSASIALQKCAKLETLHISFILNEKNYIIEMIEDLIAHCPQLSILDMSFSGGVFPVQTEGTSELLDTWKSTNRKFFGRDFRVRYRTDFHVIRYIRYFEAKLEEGWAPPIWFDYRLQIWELFGSLEGFGDGEGIMTWAFKRMNDVYIFDDMA